ncbi:MAG: ADYC domain-containing protein [Cyanobacteria bacterium J06626_18]
MARFKWIFILALVGGAAIAGGCSETLTSFFHHCCGGEPRGEHTPQPGQASFLREHAIVGATLTSFDEQGQSRTLKIDAVQRDPQDAAQEIWLYTVLHQRADGQWQNLCLPDHEGIAQAIPLAGRWDQTGTHLDDNSITFACTNGALAKCVRWGYKPWKTVQGESLQDYHQACTRMVRADYCGNGIGHTQNGIPIDVYDRLGIQSRTQQSGMTFEAAWGVDGAVYLHRPRFSEAIAQLQVECPAKLKLLSQAASPLEHDPRAEIPEALVFNDSFIQPETP